MTDQAQHSPEAATVPLLFQQALPPVDAQPIAMAQRASDLCAAAARAVIANDAGMKNGASLDKMIQAALKMLDDERTSWVKPLNDYVKRINGRFKVLTGPLDIARMVIQGKMIAYKCEQDRIAQEAAEAARKAAEEQALAQAQALEAQGKTEQAEAVLEQAVELPPTAPHVPAGPVRSDLGAVASFVDDPKWEVADMAQVPREWLCVDEKKLNQAVKKDGVRAIPGIRIWVDQRMVTR